MPSAGGSAAIRAKLAETRKTILATITTIVLIGEANNWTVGPDMIVEGIVGLIGVYLVWRIPNATTA